MLPVAITPYYMSLLDQRDPLQPLRKTVVPVKDEFIRTPGEADDPLGEDGHSPVPGLVHRYPDRVLLKLANVCPVYCRFCFRRESVGKGEDATLTSDEFAAALDYIRSKPQIFEVIVTGGDPLILSSRRIAEVTAALSAIAHVAVIRWHTRVPVVAPERVSAELSGSIVIVRNCTVGSTHGWNQCLRAALSRKPRACWRGAIGAILVR